jgi:hypothetical protein
MSGKPWTLSTCVIDLNKIKNLTDDSEEQLFWEDFLVQFEETQIFEYVRHNEEVKRDDPDYSPNFMTPFEFVTVAPVEVSKLLNTFQSDVDLNIEQVVY